MSAMTHAQLGEVLAGLRLGVSASDLHGSLTGYLCGGACVDTRDWLAALELDSDDAVDLPRAALDRLHDECAAWLGDPGMRFEPLLPAADTALEVRAEALVEWCRGFLGGLGLSGELHRRELSDEASEILRDFDAIAGSHFEYGDSEEDESALIELAEFIRVGVLLLHTELRTRRGPGQAVH